MHENTDRSRGMHEDSDRGRGMREDMVSDGQMKTAMDERTDQELWIERV